MTMLEIALSYLDKGFSVMPIWSPSMVERRAPKNYHEELKGKIERNYELENPEPEEIVEKKHLTDQCKRPVLYRWEEYKTRRPTREEVTNWFNENPDANIAVITGEVSQIIVMDLDSTDAERYAEEKGGFGSTHIGRASCRERV